MSGCAPGSGPASPRCGCESVSGCGPCGGPASLCCGCGSALPAVPGWPLDSALLGSCSRPRCPDPPGSGSGSGPGSGCASAAPGCGCGRCAQGSPFSPAGTAPAQPRAQHRSQCSALGCAARPLRRRVLGPPAELRGRWRGAACSVRLQGGVRPAGEPCRTGLCVVCVGWVQRGEGCAGGGGRTPGARRQPGRRLSPARGKCVRSVEQARCICTARAWPWHAACEHMRGAEPARLRAGPHEQPGRALSSPLPPLAHGTPSAFLPRALLASHAAPRPNCTADTGNRQLPHNNDLPCADVSLRCACWLPCGTPWSATRCAATVGPPADAAAVRRPALLLLPAASSPTATCSWGAAGAAAACKPRGPGACTRLERNAAAAATGSTAAEAGAGAGAPVAGAPALSAAAICWHAP